MYVYIRQLDDYSQQSCSIGIVFGREEQERKRRYKREKEKEEEEEKEEKGKKGKREKGKGGLFVKLVVCRDSQK